MRRHLAFLAILLTAAVAPAFADTYSRQPGLDVEHYAFRLTLADDSDAIEGEATVAVRVVREGQGTLRLDLTTEAGGKGMTVSSVTRAGAPAGFTHRENVLSLALDPIPRAGDLLTLTIRYRGVPGKGLRIGPQ